MLSFDVLTGIIHLDMEPRQVADPGGDGVFHNPAIRPFCARWADRMRRAGRRGPAQLKNRFGKLCPVQSRQPVPILKNLYHKEGLSSAPADGKPSCFSDFITGLFIDDLQLFCFII